MNFLFRGLNDFFFTVNKSMDYHLSVGHFAVQ
jgi:hypothetical protein